MSHIDVIDLERAMQRFLQLQAGDDPVAMWLERARHRASAVPGTGTAAKAPPRSGGPDSRQGGEVS